MARWQSPRLMRTAAERGSCSSASVYMPSACIDLDYYNYDYIIMIALISSQSQSYNHDCIQRLRVALRRQRIHARRLAAAVASTVINAVINTVINAVINTVITTVIKTVISTVINAITHRNIVTSSIPAGPGPAQPFRAAERAVCVGGSLGGGGVRARAPPGVCVCVCVCGDVGNGGGDVYARGRRLGCVRWRM